MAKMQLNARKVEALLPGNNRTQIFDRPCAFVPRPATERARERVYSDDELKAIWDAFETIGIVGDLFKMQLLTAARPGEVSEMEWRELELSRAIWTQPGAKTKNGKVHVVPLSPPCGFSKDCASVSSF
jgi:integrase